MNRDWVDKDFYRVLGVNQGADQDEIKRAYRKLAQQYHPDAHPGDKAAEDKFKEISEAYATLSNPDQRKEYDQVRRLVESGGFAGGGAGPFTGFGGQRVQAEDLSDLLGGLGGIGDLFGFGGSRRAGPRRGQDATAELSLSFEDAVRGVTTSVRVRGQAPCSRCHGSGAEPGTSVQTCPTCQGTGTVAQNQGFFSFSQPCSRCGGSGRVVEQPCTQCRGRGSEVRSRTMKVRVPAGVGDGSTIRLRGKGGPGANGGPPGDLLVTVHCARHPVFGRRGNDLTITIPISFTEAALGTKVEVPTLDGQVTLKVPSGTQSGRTFRVRGRGVHPEKGKAGDLLVRVEVAVPKKVTKDERKLLEQLAALETENLRSHLEV